MNELQLWRCSICKSERTWGHRSPITHPNGVWLNCDHCRRMTLHRFTGEHKSVQSTNYYYFERRSERVSA